MLGRTGSSHIVRALRAPGAKKLSIVIPSVVTITKNRACFDDHSKQRWIRYWTACIRVVSLGGPAVGALNLFEGGVLRHPEQFVMGHIHGRSVALGCNKPIRLDQNEANKPHLRRMDPLFRSFIYGKRVRSARDVRYGARDFRQARLYVGVSWRAASVTEHGLRGFESSDTFHHRAYGVT